MIDEDPVERYQNIRKAAEVHRVVRHHIQKTIRPGMKLKDIADEIEDGVRALVEADGLEAGIAFPTGLNLNHCAAHYSPKSHDTTGTFRPFWFLSISQPELTVSSSTIRR